MLPQTIRLTAATDWEVKLEGNDLVIELVKQKGRIILRRHLGALMGEEIINHTLTFIFPQQEDEDIDLDLRVEKP